MKMGLIAIGIILIILIFLFTFNHYLLNSIIDITNDIEITKALVDKNNYNSAYYNFNNIKEKWDRYEKIFKLLIEDEVLDNVEELFVILDTFFEKNKYDDFFEAINRLDYLIKNLYKKNLATVETVF